MAITLKSRHLQPTRTPNWKEAAAMPGGSAPSLGEVNGPLVSRAHKQDRRSQRVARRRARPTTAKGVIACAKTGSLRSSDRRPRPSLLDRGSSFSSYRKAGPNLHRPRRALCLILFERFFEATPAFFFAVLETHADTKNSLVAALGSSRGRAAGVAKSAGAVCARIRLTVAMSSCNA